MTSSTASDVFAAENLDIPKNPLNCIINFQGHTVSEMKLLYRCALGIMKVCGKDAFDPPDWQQHYLALALRLSLKDSEKDSAKTVSCWKK